MNPTSERSLCSMRGCVNVRARESAYRCIGVCVAMRYHDREGAWKGRAGRSSRRRKKRRRRRRFDDGYGAKGEGRFERGRVDGVVREA